MVYLYAPKQLTRDPQQKTKKTQTNGARGENTKKKKTKRRKKIPPHIKTIVFPQEKCACCVPEDDAKKTHTTKAEQPVNVFPCFKNKRRQPQLPIPRHPVPFASFSLSVH